MEVYCDPEITRLQHVHNGHIYTRRFTEFPYSTKFPYKRIALREMAEEFAKDIHKEYWDKFKPESEITQHEIDRLKKRISDLLQWNLFLQDELNKNLNRTGNGKS